ncbi:MAG: HAMP domain-containing protein [Marinilabiliaceae bacterium]|nr:HAMP domain-containing protein [Marinilabiliaceae bacterium]
MKKIVGLFIFALIAWSLNEWLARFAPDNMAKVSVSHVELIMNHHEKAISNTIDDLTCLLEPTPTDSIQLLLSEYSRTNHSPYEIYFFRGNQLVAWTNAELPKTDYRYLQRQSSIFRSDNGWYYKQSADAPHLGDHLFVLLRIKQHYPFDNEYLQNEWHESFDMSSRCSIILNASPNDTTLTDVNDSNGHRLFSIRNNLPTLSSETLALTSFLQLICLSAWLMAALVMIWLTTRHIATSIGGNRAVLIALPICLLVYVWASMSTIPLGSNQLSLFSPQTFAYSSLVPSLAFLGLGIILFMLWCIMACQYVDSTTLRQRLPIFQNDRYYLLLGIFILTAIFIAINWVINIMVYHSADLMLYVDSIDVSATSLIKTIIITLLWMCYIIALEGVYRRTYNAISWRVFLNVLLPLTALLILPIDIFSDIFSHSLTIGFLFSNIIVFYSKRHHEHGMHFSSYVWFMFASALFILFRLTMLNNDKEHQNRELLMNNLTFELMREDDPIAEQLIVKMEPQLRVDSLLSRMVLSGTLSLESETELYTYLRTQYFDGYFSRYDLQIIPCHGPNSFIQLTNDGLEYNCYEYFNGMIETYGSRIAHGSNFYCLYDNDGLASYFGLLRFFNPMTQQAERLYLELNAHENSAETGYPELLVNKRDRINNHKQLKGYSYAKYYDNILSTHFGSYQYPRRSADLPTNEGIEPDSIARFEVLQNNHCHLINRVQNGQTILLSYPTMTPNQLLANYSYLLIAMLTIMTTLLYIGRHAMRIIYVDMSIHERMQSAFITLSLVLFILFCIIASFQSVNRLETASRSRMASTLSSMTKELSRAFYANTSPTDMDNLMQQLADHYTEDAHLYSPKGTLIGTSRRELFINSIKSPLIDDMALTTLQQNNTDEVFQQEQIGKLSFYSIYAPIRQPGSDEVAAYINIPYFEDLKAQRIEIISTLRPMTNLYMIIILLSILASYFLASSITKPLMRLRSGLQHVDLRKRNEKLSYPHNDEIGQLVGEYNRMLDELESSAQKLAASERESTWRNMARQIAHEIKNPLTPMKLSVQYLLKSWDERREDFDAFIRRISKTLIDQIDQLAHTATQFSALAKTPNGEASRVNVVDRLETSVSLFSREPDLNIRLRRETNDAYAMINADQLTSVFNNLLKNAQQARRNDQEVVDIMTHISTNDNVIVIVISDNGKGIPNDIKENIFKPNFTTKSTGMGLGLAIVNKIILDAGGHISFTSKENEGTSFTITLPQG